MAQTLGIIGSGDFGSAVARLRYVQPYLLPRPDGLDRERAARWFFDVEGVIVPAAHVRELVGAAVRGSAGGFNAIFDRN